jgi:hypothetical protein
VKKTVLILAGTVGGLVLVAGVAYGCWSAWDRGLIPGNPRAPVLAAMEDAVRRSAESRFRSQPVPCIELDSPVRPELQGVRGIAYRPVPGQHAVTYLVEGSPQTQGGRDRAIRQLSYLASQGLFTEADVAVETDAGMRPGKEFRLTWDGFVAIESDRGMPCFAAGTRKIDRIGTIEKSGSALGLETWEVSIQTSVAGTPEWVGSPEGKVLFPSANEAADIRTETVRLVRGKDGWHTEQEMQAELQTAQLRSAGRENILAAAILARSLEPGNLQMPDEATVRTAFERHLTGERWQSNGMTACLPLQIQRGGDLRLAQTSVDRSVVSATWFDASPPARNDAARSAMLTQLHILAALESGGLATAYRAAAGEVNGERVTSGMRFDIAPEAVEFLGMTGSGCVPVGRIDSVELLGYRTRRDGVQIVGRGKVSQVQPLAHVLAAQLPALKSLLEDGLPYSGRVVLDTGFDPEGAPTGRQWRVVELSPDYPRIQYTLVPASLRPYFPRTHGQVKPVKAPMVLPGLPATNAQATSRSVPYPAGAADVHVVSVTEGSLPAGETRGFQEVREGVVNVVVGRTARPALLFLFSHQPVDWRVSVQGGSLARVVAAGDHEPRVTVTGARGVPVTTHKSTELFKEIGVDLSNGFPHEAEGNKALDLAEIMLGITGKVPVSFQADRGDPRNFRIDANSPAVKLPQAKSATGSVGPVVLRGPWKEATTDLTVRYGGAGAYSQAWASRAYSAGKVYFEATIGVQGGGAAKPHANLGVAEVDARGQMDSSIHAQTPAIEHGEQAGYRDQDVFGIAVDYDTGTMHVRVNGRWLTGQPANGPGKRFKVGRERAAYVMATGGGNGGDREAGAVSWRVNFGASRFRDPLPAGFVSYDGSQP